MYKLLKANLFRLKRDNIFLVFIVISIGVALFTIFQAKGNEGYEINAVFLTSLDEVLVKYIYYIGFFMAFFISLFIGKEYGEGVIRNKIITGHKKTDIYLANLICCILVAIMMVLVYMSIVLLVGIGLFGKLKMSLAKYAFIMLKIVIVIISYCSIYNFITLLSTDMSISLIINITIFVIMWLSSYSLYMVIIAQPYYTTETWDEQGVKQVEIGEVNPNYPSKTKRNIAKIVYYTLPIGLTNETEKETKEYENSIVIPLYYPIMAVIVINLVGIELFKKKELK